MRLIRTLLLVCCVAVPPWSCLAEELSLYQAMEIVTGTDLRERPRGFALCLEDVLVKLSGDPRPRSDRRVAALRPRAADYVAAFNYADPIAGVRPKDDQGTDDRSENLTVTFDPAKIDALLASLGEKPWHGPRPVLIPVLTVHGREPPMYLLTTDEPLAAEQRAAFERIAGETGIALRFPAGSAFRKRQTSDKRAPCGPATRIVVVGSLDWSETAPGWVGQWHACWRGRQHVWSIRGGGHDLAFANIVQGAVLLASGRGSPERLPARPVNRLN